MSTDCDIAIIGAGPGGLAAAANAASQNMSHILFESSEVGNTIYDYQLKKLVMAEPRKLPLGGLVQFKEGTREEVLAGFHKCIEDYKINLQPSRVLEIKKSGEGFLVITREFEFKVKSIVLAIGNMGTPRKLGAPGEDLPHIAYTLSDPAAFSNKHISIIGAGDSAIENALALMENNKVTLINRRAEFPRAKSANRKKILEAIKNGEINCFYDTKIKKCTEAEISLDTPNGEAIIPCEHIIVRAGNIPPREFLENCGIKFPSSDPASYPQVDGKYQSNVKGIYIIGALIGYPLIKQAINQGHEVVEHILGREVEPADTPLIAEVTKDLNLSPKHAVDFLRERLPLFKELSDPQFRELIIDSTLHVLDKNQVIFEKNASGDSFWNIVTESVDIKSPHGEGVIFNLKAGNFFGEMGLISGRRRSATVVAGAKNAILLETKRNQILKLMGSVPSLNKAIDEVFFLRILQTSVFPNARVNEILKMIRNSEQVEFNKGEYLFKEGEPGDALYVILKGSVKISKVNEKSEDIAQTYIPAGNYVGEMAILSDGLRSASVSAAVRVELLKISKEVFTQFLNENPEAKADIESLARERSIENLTSLRDRHSGEVLDFVLKEGISDADNVLLIDSDLCVGCDNCEKACAATHDGYSRLDRKKGKSFASIQVPISCRHCENPLCMLDCPPDALTRLSSGEVIIKDTCIGCGNCVSNCPYDVIQLVYQNKEKTSIFSMIENSILSLVGKKKKKKDKGPAKAAKCDMCVDLHSGPACVRSCPTGAAIRANPKQAVEILLSKGVSGE